MPNLIKAKRWVLQELLKAKNENRLTISGAIYIDKKPDNQLEDLVINSIVSEERFFQPISINVNCYVPDLKISHGDTYSYMPDLERLEQIEIQVRAILKDNVKKQVYRSFIESVRQEKEVEANFHFINFSIRINAVNY